MVMSVVLRSIDTLLKWTGVALIASPLLWVALARIDVPLSAEAQAWRQPEPDEIAADQNAYYAIIGFYAEDAQADINRAGRQMLGEYLERLKIEPDLKEFKYRQERKIAGKPSELCSPLTGSCLQLAREHRDELERLTKDNAVLLQRYYSLHRYPHHRETAPSLLSSPLPAYPGAIHDLFLAQIALETRGEQTSALEALARDTDFWRMVLRDSRHLIGKMLATRYVLANLHLLSDILVSSPIRERDAALVAQMLRPLDDEDRDLTAAMRNEYRIAAAEWFQSYDRGVRQGLEKHSWVTRTIVLPFAFAAVRPNHTTNLLQERFAELARTARTGPSGNTAQIAPSKKRRFGDSPWDFLYNPLGKFFVYETPPEVSAYSARIGDLDGFVRLVTLQSQIRKNRIAASDVPAFLAASPDTLRDPYTGRPMNWNAEVRTLWFARKGGRKNEKGILEVRL